MVPLTIIIISVIAIGQVTLSVRLLQVGEEHRRPRIPETPTRATLVEVLEHAQEAQQCFCKLDQMILSNEDLIESTVLQLYVSRDCIAVSPCDSRSHPKGDVPDQRRDGKASPLQVGRRESHPESFAADL